VGVVLRIEEPVGTGTWFLLTDPCFMIKGVVREFRGRRASRLMRRASILGDRTVGTGTFMYLISPMCVG
jgi:hypothetical protein